MVLQTRKAHVCPGIIAGLLSESDMSFGLGQKGFLLHPGPFSRSAPDLVPIVVPIILWGSLMQADVSGRP